ncbi:MAG TPA: hypothetical protein VEB40_00880 [Flavipsychrobacter sp.]|nr:hypothetical protein [Flavipsychrobacter sp.]
MKNIFAILMVISFYMITASSCKKDKTEYQPKGDYVTSGTNVNTVKVVDFAVAWAGLPVFIQYFPDIDMDGGIFIYVKSGSTFAPLPVTFDGMDLSYEYDSAQRKVMLYADNYFVLMNENFRLIAIPPGARIGVDMKNYDEVRKAFNLQ